jgi:anti-anti-sigma factor
MSVVRVVGDIDSSSYLRLYDGVMAELYERCCHGLIIDLSEVVFCCASGLSCLIQAHDAAQQVGVDLRVAVPPSAALLGIWRLRDLRDTLKIAPTAAAARTSIHADWNRSRVAAHH